MSSDRRDLISDLYHRALARAPEERAAFLIEASHGDEALRQEVASLLEFEPASAGILERPAIAIAAVGVGANSMIDRRIGPYTIVARLGGPSGMGEVYRARDRKLGRDVALKILPSHFTADAERRARFAREARLLATLNHPHIGAIYGLEEADGTTALILELVEGQTLADRLERGPVPLPLALTIARQVAEALDAAHGKGIVHRDLKPANIVLEGAVDRPSNDVQAKVIDFGLAKPTALEVAAGPTQAASDSFDGTAEGRILGTPAYMSPEQARGLAIDKRSDIWAFGCVLFEMLSGRRAFEGATITDTIAHVLEREPDWTQLPSATPPAILRLLERCLRKEPQKRLRDIADALDEIEDRSALESVRANAVAGATPRPSHRRERLAWILAASVTMAVPALWLFGARLPTAPPELVEFPIAAPEGSRFTGTSPQVAISPDGRHVAFTASSILWVRSLGSLDLRAIPGTEAAQYPFWSPDSKSIGFFANRRLKTIRVDGGKPVDLCAVGDVGPARHGGTWSRDTIVFGPIRGVLHSVPSRGGSASRPVTTLQGNEVLHQWPWLLEDGTRFLYLALSDYKGLGGELRLRSMASGAEQVLGPFESHASYAAGHLFFVRGGNLKAWRFDPDAGRLIGEALTLSVKVGIDPPWQQGTFSISATGRLVYRPVARPLAQLTWFDRDGQTLGYVGGPDVIFNLDLSRDGRQVAVSKLTQQAGNGAQFDIWLRDLATGTEKRLTDDPAWEFDPTWSPDSTRVAFNSNRPSPGTPYRLFFRREDRTGGDVELVGGPSRTSISGADWSKTDVIAFNVGETGSGNLWTMPMSGDGVATPFLATEHVERSPGFSPDGRFIAYQSNESGRFEVQVRPYPAKDPVRVVSREGGSYPRWRGDGRELFFLSPSGGMMASRVDATAGFRADVPRRLFPTTLTGGNEKPYAVSADGQRFLIPVVSDEPLRVVLDWRSLILR
jgi:serine/threonine protein kinase